MPQYLQYSHSVFCSQGQCRSNLIHSSQICKALKGSAPPYFSALEHCNCLLTVIDLLFFLYTVCFNSEQNGVNLCRLCCIFMFIEKLRFYYFILFINKLFLYCWKQVILDSGGKNVTCCTSKTISPPERGFLKNSSQSPYWPYTLTSHIY